MGAGMVGSTAGVFAGAASPIPGGSIVGAGLGAAAAEEAFDRLIARPMGMVDTRGAGEQALDAAVSGGLAAAGQKAGEFIGQGVREGAKRLFRGGDAVRREMASRAVDFERTGAGQGSAALLTNNRAIEGIESILAKFPGAAGNLAKKAEAMHAQVGKSVNVKAKLLAGRTDLDPEIAGRAITGGITKFTESFKATGGKLYDKLDAFIP